MSEAQLITALPTPFTADEQLDTDGLTAVATRIRDSGVDGVFAPGTTGEFTALDDDERLTVLRVALEVFGPDRTYAHVGAAAPRQAERLARAAVEAGARKVAAITPFYLPAPEDALLRYFERVVAPADGAHVFAYLFQARSTTPAPPPVLRRLADVRGGCAKPSGESDDSVAAFLAEAPAGFAFFSGNDVSYAELVRSGGTGVVSGVSSVFPEPFTALRDALRAGDAAAAAAAQPLVERAVAAVKAGNIAHLKAGLEVRGLPAGPPRVSCASVSAADLAELRATAAAVA